MPNRLIKESICTSDNLDMLSADEERFFYRLLVNCDDFGRYDGRPAILRAKLFPLKVDTIKESHITKWLQSLVKANLIFIYGDDDKQFIQMITWEDHQQIRAKRSKYPDIDSNGYHMISDANICPRNPIQSNPIQIQPRKAERFEAFWKIYPKKKNKGYAEKAFFKINPDDDLLEIMISKIKQAKMSRDWLKDNGQYIPNPSTWLNAKGWKDEIEENVTESKYTGS